MSSLALALFSLCDVISCRHFNFIEHKENGTTNINNNSGNDEKQTATHGVYEQIEYIIIHGDKKSNAKAETIVAKNIKFLFSIIKTLSRRCCLYTDTKPSQPQNQRMKYAIRLQFLYTWQSTCMNTQTRSATALCILPTLRCHFELFTNHLSHLLNEPPHFYGAYSEQKRNKYA